MGRAKFITEMRRKKSTKKDKKEQTRMTEEDERRQHNEVRRRTDRRAKDCRMQHMRNDSSKGQSEAAKVVVTGWMEAGSEGWMVAAKEGW